MRKIRKESIPLFISVTHDCEGYIEEFQKPQSNYICDESRKLICGITPDLMKIIISYYEKEIKENIELLKENGVVYLRKE